MIFLKQNTNSIVLCLFEALIGILLLINPIGFTSGIIITGGIILMIMGIASIIRYFRTDVLEAAISQSLAKGLITLLAGAFCTFRSRWFITTFPLLTIVYGVFVLLIGCGKIQMTVDMIRRKNNKWFLAAISAAISLVCAVVILNNPFSTTVFLWTFTGVSLLVEAVFDVITLIVRRKEI